MKNQITMASLALMLCLCLESQLFAAGVWTPLNKLNPAGGCGTMMLLTDGTVMVQGPGTTAAWYKLTPDSSGNYVNGTWSATAAMGTARLYFGSNVLPNGKVFVVGGEYTPAGQVVTNTGEIYDPVTNKWTAITPFPNQSFGDDPTVLLPNGKVLCGYIFGPQTYLYDPSTNLWTQTGTKLRSDRSDEETWVMLPGGSILSYDVFSSSETGTGHAQRYIPASGTWVDAGVVPVPLTGNAFGSELGPATLLPNGKLLQIGANNNTVIYTPTSNTWATGPTLPANMGADDAPGAMLPNGHFLFAADTSAPVIFTGPTKLYDYDYTTNTITDVTPTTGPMVSFLNDAAFSYRMLVLPNGHMLLCYEGSGQVWDYAPTGAPLASWAPAITTITGVTNVNYKLSGTQLTGISEGASYGDDAEMSTNYPIVRLTSDKGVVTYARTTNWTPGVATGSLVTSVDFSIPGGMVGGTYQVAVIANGIASASKSLFIGGTPSNVTATYSAGTLTLTGDASVNSLTVSVQAGVVKVEGANGTKINGNPTFSSVHSGKLKVIANLNDGDDFIAFIGIDSSTTDITLGKGNDKASFTLCKIVTLTIDGGEGTDVLLTTSTTIGTTNKTNFP